MPNAVTGFSGNEIVERVRNFIGNVSDSFKEYIQQSLPMAEMRFSGSHDWLYLHKAGLPLSIYNGVAEYALSVANIGYEMHATDVETIFDETNGFVLRRKDLNQIRRIDPETDDGTAEDYPRFWAPVTDNIIRFWPPTFKDGILKIDGKISGSNLWNDTGLVLTNSPYIPPHYQESFIKYVTAMALLRENDDRYLSTKQEALSMIKDDIREDMRNIGNTENARIKWIKEVQSDGVGANLEALFVGWYDPYYDYWM